MSVTPDPVADESGTHSAFAMLGHDLRAALGDMRAGLSLLDRHDVPPALQAVLDQCRAASDSLSRLIDQTVRVCLCQGSPVTTAPGPVATRAFLTQIRQQWTGLAAMTGHRFVLIEAGDQPACFCIDRTALERILANLLSNAIHHTPPCQITLTFKISGGDLLLLAIEDDGPGFPAAHIAAIERNLTLPPEARRTDGGLGLQSVRQLVQSMGGRCDARNKDSSGAHIRLSLPLCCFDDPKFAGAPCPASDATSATGHTATAPGSPKLAPLPDLTGTRLFLADDSASSRELVGILARHIGATISMVEDGKAAMQALQDQPLPDVLILDDDMPGATGLEVLHWLRAAKDDRAKLPVLALTSHIGTAEVAALYQAGAVEVLAKPVLCPLELGRAIRSVQGLAATLTPSTLAPSTTDQTIIDLDLLQQLAHLAGPVAATELFEKMQEDLTFARSGLSQGAAVGDLAAIRAHSHVIIALAGTAGAMGLHDDAVTLNIMAQDNAPTERSQALAMRLDGALDALLQAVGQMGRKAGALRVLAEQVGS